jgi:5-methylcytosine-specific restriction endonuclease McrA
MDVGERAPVIRWGERDTISRTVRRLVYQRDDWTCQNCGAVPNARDPHRRSGALHLDHIIPWSAGGSDRSDNLRTLCATCNETRSNYIDGHETPSLPITLKCTRCLVLRDLRFKPWLSSDFERFDVYCATCERQSWAIKGWHIL